MDASRKAQEGGADAPPDPPPFAAFRQLSSERIYDSTWCGLRRDVVRLPDGSDQEYHVFEIPDAAVVVPVLRDGGILMIGQYRYPHGGTHWEVPAGRIADGESPEACARRELLEEAGHRAGRVVPLPGFYPTNGISPHFAHAFLATDCVRVAEPTPDASEQLVLARFTHDEVRALLRSGRVRDVFSAASLLYYLGFHAG